MSRERVLKSPAYWAARIQMALYECAGKFMKKKGMNKKQLAEHLGVSAGYVTQVLNGGYDHRLSKFVELSMDFGYIPKIQFVPIETVVEESGRRVTAKSSASVTFKPADDVEYLNAA